MIDDKELRGFVLEALKANGSNSFDSIKFRVEKLAIEREVIPNEGMPGHRLEKGDIFRINDLLWTFLLQGIILPGVDDINLELPHFHVTNYGKQCLEHNRVLPYDPDGYLKEIKQKIPHLNPIARSFIEESLQCFLKDIPRASTVMLGVASEQIILDLIESFTEALPDSDQKERLRKIINSSTMIWRKYTTFLFVYDKMKGNYPKKLVHNSETWIKYVFDMIRTYRNETGHPNEIYIENELAFANLRLFIPYVEKVYQLIDYFKNFDSENLSN